MVRKVAAYARKHFGVRGRVDSLPRLAKTDRVGFAKMLGDLGINKGVEVGTREGRFAVVLCQQNPNIELTCIDPWAPYARWTEERQAIFFSRTARRTARYNVKLLKKYSMDALSDFEDGSLDFAYIDADHAFDFVCPDIIYWSKKVKSGGIVAAHDYFHFRTGGVVHAVDAYTRAHNIPLWYATFELTPTAFWVKP